MKELFLMIGNSRLHWALFNNNSLISTWDSQHLSENFNQDYLNQFFPQNLNLSRLFEEKVTLNLASVVPPQTKFFLEYPQLKMIILADIPIKNLYSTLGIDRALALYGTLIKYGFPALVIDGGTALTLTGINQDQELVGGAIFPGLKLQFNSLFLQTANLPKINFSDVLPPRWALTTPCAIESGIIYTVLAGLCDFIKDWLREFPESEILVTGGDRQYLIKMLKEYQGHLGEKMREDGNLIFWGMKYLNCSK